MGWKSVNELIRYVLTLCSCISRLQLKILSSLFFTFKTNFRQSVKLSNCQSVNLSSSPAKPVCMGWKVYVKSQKLSWNEIVYVKSSKVYIFFQIPFHPLSFIQFRYQIQNPHAFLRLGHLYFMTFHFYWQLLAITGTNHCITGMEIKKSQPAIGQFGWKSFKNFSLTWKN